MDQIEDGLMRSFSSSLCAVRSFFNSFLSKNNKKTPIPGPSLLKSGWDEMLDDKVLKAMIILAQVQFLR
jgi:hypothetical protein